MSECTEVLSAGDVHSIKVWGTLVFITGEAHPRPLGENGVGSVFTGRLGSGNTFLRHCEWFAAVTLTS